MNGVYKQLAQIIGLEDCLLIYKNYKGLTITFPTKLIDSEYVKRIVEAHLMTGQELTGKEIQGLASTYDYSERQIRRYIKEIKNQLVNAKRMEEAEEPYVIQWLKEQNNWRKKE